jgi:curved DNA-binding protein CbpA
MANNYVILNLKQGATIAEIKTRFRILCKEYHPDKTGGDKDKTAKFIIIKDAYEALLKGDGGNYNKQAKDSNFRKEKYKKTATYKFVTIKKDKKGFLISFDVYGVETISIFGKDRNNIGTYDVSRDYGRVN